ncbi:MAG: hypothetical protein QOG74_3385 [Alphaproteobacteria bacterium]|jgi:hypothetical protein|nr:hypothetical protein [Alphaproteobacteria bacterium]
MISGVRPDATPMARHVVLGACAAVAIGMMAATPGRAGEAAWTNSGAFWRVQDSGVPQPPRRPPVLNTLKDIGLALGICWTAHLPPPEQARPGMRVTVMLTFTRSGEILGEPRFTFVTPEAAPETRALYQRVAVDAIGTCTPLPFSEGLGNAVAGRPNIFPFVDWRNAKGA